MYQCMYEHFSTSVPPKMAQECHVFNILTCKCAWLQSGVPYFDIGTSTSGPNHLQKWWQNAIVLYIFVPQRPAIFDIGTSESGLIPVCFVHFDSVRASCLRTRFSEPTVRPSRPGNHRQNRAIRDFSSISRACIFFLLTFARLYLLSPDSTFLLCFSSLQMVGSSFDKYVCIEPGKPAEVSETKVREYKLSARRPTSEMPKRRFLCAGLQPFGLVVAFGGWLCLRKAWACVCQVGVVKFSLLRPCFLLFFLCLLVVSSTATICAQCSMPERTSEQIAVGCCLPQASLQTTTRTVVEMRPDTFNFTYWLWEIFWHSSWHLFCHSVWHSSHISSDILCLTLGILSDVLSGITSDLLSSSLSIAHLLTLCLTFFLAFLLTLFLAVFQAHPLMFFLAYLPTFFLVSLLIFFLASLLAFFLASLQILRLHSLHVSWHSFWHLSCHSVWLSSHISSDILFVTLNILLTFLPANLLRFCLAFLWTVCLPFFACLLAFFLAYLLTSLLASLLPLCLTFFAYLFWHFVWHSLQFFLAFFLAFFLPVSLAHPWCSF